MLRIKLTFLQTSTQIKDNQKLKFSRQYFNAKTYLPDKVFRHIFSKDIMAIEERPRRLVQL